MSVKVLEVAADLGDIRRFLAKVEDAHDKSGCWIWTGAMDEKGYPQFSYEAKTVGARRFAMSLFKGLVAVKRHMKATSECLHYKQCVNPNHTAVKCKP